MVVATGQWVGDDFDAPSDPTAQGKHAERVVPIVHDHKKPPIFRATLKPSASSSCELGRIYFVRP